MILIVRSILFTESSDANENKYQQQKQTNKQQQEQEHFSELRAWIQSIQLYYFALILWRINFL